MAGSRTRFRAGWRTIIGNERTDSCHTDTEADFREGIAPGRIHFRHGPEHGGLVPSPRFRTSRRARHIAPRRDAEARRLALHGQLARRASDRYLYSSRPRKRNLGTALRLARISLRGNVRLSRPAGPGFDRGPRGE